MGGDKEKEHTEEDENEGEEDEGKEERELAEEESEEEKKNETDEKQDTGVSKEEKHQDKQDDHEEKNDHHDEDESGQTPDMKDEGTASKEEVHEDIEREEVHAEEEVEHHEIESPQRKRKTRKERFVDDDDDDEIDLSEIKEPEILDPKVASDMEYIKDTEPTTRLEIALSECLKRKEAHIDRLSSEVQKLKAFISKRKQTYKRKRKDEGAPTRALSAYNIFVQDRFAELAKQNEAALKSADSDAQLKRVPPANLVAATGNQWKELPPEEKVKYEERAKQDRKRYEEQMAQYQPPDKQANRKRNKTGYNMFFSAHVLRLKQSEMGVPSERGSVARLVGNAWKVSSRTIVNPRLARK